jgi:acyl-homoserine lactone acylase PvdQ
MHDRDVLTPGEGGSLVPTAYSTDQIPLYNGLTPLGGKVTASDVTRYFKADSLGGTAGRRERVPLTGLTIIRDKYDIPHIYGKTRAEVEFGAGWVAAEDRGLVLQLTQTAGALAALDAPGLDAFSIAASGQHFVETQATKRFLASELTLATQAGPDGRQILTDATNYVKGINAYYKFSHSSNTPWTVEDVVAATAMIGAVFGRGGGNQAEDSSILADIEARLGESEGLAVFNDLRQAQNPDTPTTIDKTFPYEPVPTGPTPGSAVIDKGSLQQVNPLTPRRHMSNALVLGPSRTATGSSVAVMGPQVGYFYPEILLEMDIEGGGLDARGASFPGTSLYVEIGRGRNFAWSATSSGAENVDQFLERLCNPDGSPATRSSTHYVYDGHCVAMTTLDAGYLEPGAGPGGEVVIKETVNGPVSGTCTVGGVPYAVTTLRSTHGRDVMSALGFEELNDGYVDSPQTFLVAASHIEFTFNWFYADARHVALFSSGRLPIRAAGTNPTLPTYGDGHYEWRGFLPPGGHPQAIDPAGQELVNWNNQPAPGFGAASDNWNEGPIDHVLLLLAGLHGNHISPQDDVAAMNNAAGQDARGLVWPVIARVLAGGPAPNALAARAADTISAWVRTGSVVYGSGRPDPYAAGQRILDSAWSNLVGADLSPVLGSLWGEIPGDGLSYLDEDLSTLLGMHLPSHYSRIYCGDGNLARCRASLWAAFSSAVGQLAHGHGTDPNRWLPQSQSDTFAPGLLPNQMLYSNRPTFQQVVWFG